jgi:hypothetical protein
VRASPEISGGRCALGEKKRRGKTGSWQVGPKAIEREGEARLGLADGDGLAADARRGSADGKRRSADGKRGSVDRKRRSADVE